MTRKTKLIAFGFAAVTALFVGVVLAWVSTTAMPLSLYKPALQRSMTEQERWKLDFDLANEASMREHNSRRFDVPGSFEKRARWFEETAQWYPIADLMQQMIDFRKSAMVNNERAFNKLVELGERGDVGATCVAWMFYQHFNKEDTAKWRHKYEHVARAALKLKDSGHPVCTGIEGELYVRGSLGYPQDRSLAKPHMIANAVAGFSGSQEYMANTHLFESKLFQQNDVALNLCWRRVADMSSPVVQFDAICRAYRNGYDFDRNLKEIAVPAHIQKIASEWCEPTRTVTAQTCADLELQTERK